MWKLLIGTTIEVGTFIRKCRVAALLWHIVSVQSTLISIVLISKGAVFVGPICTQLLRTDSGEMMNYLKCVFEALP